MAKELERDLGLYAVLTVSIGAMIGSGIFVLPGIAATIGGPAVILAYLLAGLIVLPAALSKAEMATALPHSGGTYLYIDRAMGPMMGTIAGLGVWFSLVFKSAFALVGLGAYLVLFTTLSAQHVALFIAVALVAVNMLGVKKTGQLQALVVTVVLLVLLGFLVGGITFVENVNYRPFFAKGLDGLLAATGFVFVSYAGVTKIASVAEEVEDPGRNIPLGMLISIGVMMLVYTLIVFVIVGNLPPASACPSCGPNEVLGKSLTPMADAAGVFFGPAGVTVIAVTAVLALASMANAGVLSSSRYPLAMSRDRLAPDILKRVSERFRTPTFSILITGALLVVLVALVPVAELAKLASAFKILVFTLINLALIAFRESQADWYDPSFRSPLYPWAQLFGIGGGLLLLTQMGALPMVGAVLLTGGGFLYYQLYARARTTREGVGVDVLRRQADTRQLRQTERALTEDGTYRVLVPVHQAIDRDREALLLRIAADLVRDAGGTVQVVRFEEVPDQTVLPAALQMTEADVAFERQSHELARSLDVEIEVGEVVSHDTQRAVINFAKRNRDALILADAELWGGRPTLFGNKLDWLVHKAPCDVLLLKRNEGLGEVREVSVVADRGPFDPLKVGVANAIAAESQAPIHFLHAVDLDAPEPKLHSIRRYHEELGDLCSVPTKSAVLRTDDRAPDLAHAARNASLVVMQGADDGGLRRSPLADLPRRIAEEVGAPVILVYPQDRRRRTVLARLVERVLYH